MFVGIDVSQVFGSLRQTFDLIQAFHGYELKNKEQVRFVLSHYTEDEDNITWFIDLLDDNDEPVGMVYVHVRKDFMAQVLSAIRQLTGDIITLDRLEDSLLVYEKANDRFVLVLDVPAN